ncbi:MAG: hypothetical protein AAF573_14875 [Bacteroidota bacterium]
MTKTNHLSKGHLILIFGTPLLLILSTIYFSTLPEAASQQFSYALSLDFMLTVPIVYFLLIRKTKIPKTTVVTLLLGGVFMAGYFVSDEHHEIVDFAKFILVPLVEFSIVGFVLYQVRKFIIEHRKAKNESPDFLTTLRNTTREILPQKVVEPFVLEIAMIYYCFFAWKKPTYPNNSFTYHKKSSLHLIFGVFVSLVIIETFAFHILVEKWSTTVAWVGTGLSLYSIMQIIGIVKSAVRRPIVIKDAKVLLRFGLMHEAEIDYKEIEKIELSRRLIANNAFAHRMGTELTGHNTIIYLKNKNTLHGLFGIKKQFTVLMLHVDEPKIFKEKIEEKMTTSKNT